MARKGVAPSAQRMSIFNSFDKLPNGLWAMKGQQLIICACGFTDGFRVFPEGDIAKTVEDHTAECPLRH
jgi:hypothetical protein